MKPMTFLLVMYLLSNMQCCLLKASDPVSSINGMKAFVELWRDKDLQKMIELTDAQLFAVQTSFREIDRTEQRRALESRIGDYSGGNSKEANLASHDALRKVLTEEQFDRLRLTLVNRKFSSPLSIYSDWFLGEVGLDKASVNDVSTAVRPRIQQVFAKVDDLRLRCLEEALPPEEQRIAWEFFGEKLVISPRDGNWETIAQLPEAGVKQQLFNGLLVVLPEELEITPMQRRQLDDYKMKVRIAQAKKQERPDLKDISAELDNILSKRQRFAIVQRLQLQELRADLLVIMRPEIVKHFNFSDSLKAQTIAELSASKKELESERKRLELEVAKQGLMDVPPPFRQKIVRLMEGVWKLD